MSDDADFTVIGAAFSGEPLFEVEEGMYSIAMLEAMIEEFKVLREIYINGSLD